jgi:hypothetical protein
MDTRCQIHDEAVDETEGEQGGHGLGSTLDQQLEVSLGTEVIEECLRGLGPLETRTRAG